MFRVPENSIDDDFKKFSHLTEIDASFCKSLTSNCFQYLSNAIDLSLCGCKNILSIPDFKHNIQTIDMSHTPITDDDLRHFSNVKKIVLSGCSNITDKGLAYIANVPEIDLFGNNNITDEGLKQLSLVQKLNIGFCDRITDHGLKHLISVRDLNLNGCEQLVGTFLPALNNLERLILFGCIKINDACVKQLSFIKELNLSDCDVTDEGVLALGNQNPDSKVEVLGLDRCYKITDVSVKTLIGLEELSLTGCKLTNDSVKLLSNKRVLGIWAIKNITDEAILALENIDTLYMCYNNITMNALPSLVKMKKIISIDDWLYDNPHLGYDFEKALINHGVEIEF